MNRPRASLLILALLTTGCARPTTGFLDRVYKSPDGVNSKYVVFVPHGYTPDRAAPVILFLHGGGEAGTDGQRQTTVGLGPAIRAREQTFPFIVVFPQAQDPVPATFGSWLPGQPDGERALGILAAVQTEFRTDPKRVYLSGISVGGLGVWQLAAADPGRWAAIVPICGQGPRTKAAALPDVPCWCFQGTDDDVVPVQASRDMIAAIKDAGGNPKYTEFPGVGHNSWDKAYGSDLLYDWLLDQRLK
jgi:predicted peptidase